MSDNKEIKEYLVIGITIEQGIVITFKNVANCHYLRFLGNSTKLFEENDFSIFSFVLLILFSEIN
jgi:hypothetical protein